ncbi:DNA gyrase inhibitor YacG [Halomonas campisalis]|uniref:DNA gyrase inhibitor YacG n=1 Tax=Billgrantia campisalis TaxID=74661 RepID=A0ABS9P5F7_9GAMM|nr:DNA gyrase inhibitor YacG [Halomonas campisalis]MCG6657006.1 DNA gyrase inhibitor YacG [Halomonas campisalis]MDR5862192.1 DNA gyrase inhibitor YacG [Halomonas campisalis]
MSPTPQRPLEVACPECRRKVEWREDNPHRPFCSERCKLLDLGAWAEESHRIAGEPAMDETSIDEWVARAERDAGQ